MPRGMRWTPIFGRPDKVELPGREAPYQEQDDGREAASIWGGIQGEGRFGGGQGRPDDGPAGESVRSPHEAGRMTCRHARPLASQPARIRRSSLDAACRRQGGYHRYAPKLADCE
jgi:hypothetical protein